jgi:O-antigen ligase
MTGVTMRRAVWGIGTRSPLPLSIAGIWRAFWAEPWSFKFTCLYVFFEYVRPQQMYESLAFLPWPRLAIISAVAAFALEGRAIRSRTIANGLLVALTVVVLLSSFFAYSPETSLGRLIFFVNWLIAFFLIANTTTDQRKFFLFMVFFLLWSAKMSQFGARSFLTGAGSSGGAPGWFQNSGEFALQMCIFVPLSLQFVIGLYPHLSKVQVSLLALLPISGVLSIINSGSRGGVLALAFVGLWMIMQSRRKLRGVVVLALMVPVVWGLLPQYQKDRFRTAGEDETSLSRLTYWKRGLQMANDHPLLGVGYENWVPYYRDHFPPAPGELVRYSSPGQVVIEVSHNSFVEVVSQLGYSGLILFLALIGSVWYLNWQARRILATVEEHGRFLRHMSLGLDAGIVGFVIAGFFMAVALNPFVWFQLGMSAALLVSANQLAKRSRVRTGVSGKKSSRLSLGRGRFRFRPAIGR